MKDSTAHSWSVPPTVMKRAIATMVLATASRGIREQLATSVHARMTATTTATALTELADASPDTLGLTVAFVHAPTNARAMEHAHNTNVTATKVTVDLTVA